MADKYSRSLLRISVAQICQNLGWNSAQSSSLEVLTDVLERYIMKIGSTCHNYAEQYGRTEANLNDLGLAFQHLGISVAELENYVHHVEPVPFAHEVVAFPVPKSSNLGFPNPRSREILQHREEHIPEHLPYMFPNMKDEIPEERTLSPLNGAVNGIDAPPKLEGLAQEVKDDGNVGDKRSAPMSTPDLPPSKRARLANSNLPEEAGHSQYEMTCVFMGPNGVLTTRQGSQGRLPEPRMPPPNPRTLMEGANKENSGKTKDSSGGPKISISVGGIGAESVISNKNDNKKNKKSPQKRKTLHENATKTSSKELGKELAKKSLTNKVTVDGFGKELGKKLVTKTAIDGVGKELGKKSVSSKAAAKFLKKLKMSKKSSKLFSKSKVKDNKVPDMLKETSSLEKSKAQTNSEEGRKKKEKKSAEFVDTDEELRNLSSPSSRVPSPEQALIIDTESGAQKKARLEAISDSINSVLRDVPTKDGKIKKRKKKEEKSEESAVGGGSAAKGQADGKAQEPKVKRKPGRPPKVQKPADPPAPVDVKPFVSDKYSSEELQVYEFNDSPPDTSMPSRRPSAAETVAASLPPPPPPQTIVKHEPPAPAPKHATSSASSSHKFHRKIVPEDDLFAPEFKLESRIDHSDHQSVKPLKLELSKDKEKPKVKNEKKERVVPEKVSQKNKDVKGDRHKDNKKDKQKDEKERTNDDKEKHKEKEHRKDKKDKKKEKEKKKKHKEKDHVREKEKEKKPEEKVKQEARESRESSPAVGIGVKLKIKIGGGAGTPTSMMVTGEGSSPASPAPSFGSKRESMSPPRVVPKIYISKKGQGTEDKAKKSSKPSSNQHGEGSRHNAPTLPVSSKSQSTSPTSSSKTSPSPRSTPTPPVPRKTPTPPPSSKTTHKGHHSPHSKMNSSKQKDAPPLVSAKERQSRSSIKDRSSKVEKKKKERKASLSSLSSASSLSPSPPAKAPVSKRQTPPRLSRMSSSSSSPEKSPPPLPFQSQTPSPRTSSSAARSPSRASTPHHSPTPPPALSRGKPTPPPALSPRQEYHSPSPTRPPTPGSTSPPPSPDWNLPVSSPSHPRSPTPTPRTPTASPSRNIPSPTHSSPPGSPLIPLRSPSPEVLSRPGSRLMDTPEPKPHPKDNPSPASSGKSSTSLSKPARTVEAETVCVFYDDSGQKVWICPACKLPDDGSEMIGCDMCDNWYHWPCVGITEAPPEEQQWFCCKCLPKTKSSVRGRGRPRGRGRGRGRKKIT